MRRHARWVKPLLPVTLLLFAICSVSCNGWGRPVEYRPVTDQVLLVPKGSVITAPDGRKIITDGKGEKVELSETILPYDGVLVSDGTFLKLFRERVKEKE